MNKKQIGGVSMSMGEIFFPKKRKKKRGAGVKQKEKSL